MVASSLLTPGGVLNRSLPVNTQAALAAAQQPKTSSASASSTRTASLLGKTEAPSGGIISRPKARNGATLLGDTA